MSERDDMAEQMYHEPVAAAGSSTREEAQDGGLAPATRSAVEASYRERINNSDRRSAERGLNFLLGLQLEVEKVWGRDVDPDDPEAVSRYVREVVLCVEDELHEVLGEVHWKPWKDSRGIKDVAKYRAEMADVLHFILDLYLAAGLRGEDIVADYVRKHFENLGRNASPEYRGS